MASLFRIVSLKISLISVAVLSLAITLNLYFPLISEFLLSELPVLWVSLRSWLTPPYLYVVINFIIITIAASSRYQYTVDEPIPDVPVPVPVKVQENFALVPEYEPTHVPEYEPVVEFKTPDEEFLVISSVKEAETKIIVVDNQEEEKVVEEDESVKSSRTESMEEMPSRTESMEEMPSRTESLEEITMERSFSNEKPPVSARFGHRKAAKTNPEGGKSLRVTRPKRQDTLESTWKMITEGRSIPLARHLKKSDTWDTNGHEPAPPEQMQKSETMNNRSEVPSTLARSQGSGKLKKEPSLTQDDLNRRVEAFINKFNEDMRLQRLESLNRYKEMMNQGAQF